MGMYTPIDPELQGVQEEEPVVTSNIVTILLLLVFKNWEYILRLILQ